MHELALNAIVKACRTRETDGDCPTVERPGAETLEFAVLELAKMAGIGAAVDPLSTFVTFRGYQILCTLSATFANNAHGFDGLLALWERPALVPMLQFWDVEEAHTEEVPRPSLLKIGERRKALPADPPATGNEKVRLPRLREYETRPTFEISLVIPEPHTAESLLRQLADELEPHGWGILDFGRGALAKENQADIAEVLAARAEITGKPIY
jgi:hypothetical protein